MKIVPLSRKDARRFVALHHRHSAPPPGDMFRCALEHDGDILGVGIAGRPVARHLDDGATVEILRICTDGTDSACTRLYGALCRAAKALGFSRAVTYTLASEPGSSPKAAGFVAVAQVPAGDWSSPSRPRQPDLWGNQRAAQGDKVRWERAL